MKKMSIVISLIIVLLFSVLQVSQADSKIIEDPYLSSIIKYQLRINHEPEIEDLEQLDYIAILGNNDITSLKGLEYAQNIEYVEIKRSPKITDFKVLESLPLLDTVRLWSSNINDESMPLFKNSDYLTTLEYVGSDITSAGLKNLLYTPSITYLDLSESRKIDSIDILADLPNLQQLEIQFAGLHNISTLTSFPKLKSFTALGQHIKGSDSELKISELNWNRDLETITLPASVIDNHITNYNGKVYMPHLPSREAQINGVSFPIDNSASDLVISGVDESVLKSLESVAISFYFDMEGEVHLRPEGFYSYSFEADSYVKKIAIKRDIQSFSLNFEDENNRSISTPTNIRGLMFESYSVEPPKIEGYEYQKSSHDLSGKFEFDQFNSMTLTYKNIQEFKVEFDSDGGSSVESIEKVVHNSIITQPEDPIKEGFSFQGWVLDSNLWDFETMTVVEDIKLRAVWHLDELVSVPLRVEFVSNADFDIESLEDLQVGDLIVQPELPVREGYIFLGWFHGSVKWDFETMTVQENMRLVAQWQKQVTNPDDHEEISDNDEGQDNLLSELENKDTTSSDANTDTAVHISNDNKEDEVIKADSLPKTGIGSSSIHDFDLILMGLIMLLVNKKKISKGSLK